MLREARVKAGHAKFRGHQLLASNAVPLYRRLRSIDTPLANRYLFVLAHPRSGSTVLSHVLQSHDDIMGFGEHHEGYETIDDLRSLAARNAFFAREPDTTHPYTLDKIVWNHHDISDELLRHTDTRFVFLAREPVATLESYRRMFRDMTTDERRLQSYETRLDGMVDLAKRIGDPERMTFITYDELTNETASALERLTLWLELDTPITPEYDLNAKSGSQSWGDPSQHIQAGTIIKVPHDTVEIDADVIEAAQRVYRESCEALSTITTGVVTTAEQPPVRESR
jgi:hypothetical protein